MKLTEIREFNGSTFYGYTYPETGEVPYWSMKYYKEVDVDNLLEMRKFGKK